MEKPNVTPPHIPGLLVEQVVRKAVVGAVGPLFESLTESILNMGDEDAQSAQLFLIGLVRRFCNESCDREQKRINSSMKPLTSDLLRNR